MIDLYIPALDDLWFRQRFLSDSETMSYNHAWGGTIENGFHEEYRTDEIIMLKKKL